MKPLYKVVQRDLWNLVYDEISVNAFILPFDSIEWFVLRQTQNSLWFNLSAPIKVTLEERFEYHVF